MNDVLKRLVPLRRVVAGAIIDTHEDIGKVEQTYSHWAARGFKKLDREVLNTVRRKVTLTVNRSTNTATLPADFDEETFVGAIINGRKVPFNLRPELVDSKNVEDIPCEDRCDKCNQDKAICKDLTITEDTTIVIINDTPYEQTVIKKLNEDGSYYLETRIPVWDVDIQDVVYTTTKQYVAKLDLKPCGCIDDTPENISTIQCCCPDVYNAYYAPCDNSCVGDYGGYKIFEETGLIQFDKTGKFTKVYLEYWGFLVKRNGQYFIPEVSLETLIEWVKYKSVQNRKSAPDRVIERWFDNYRRERSSMEKVLGRISLSMIIQAVSLTPKFDIESGCDYWLSSSCPELVRTIAAAPVETTICDTPVCSTSTKNLSPFGLAVIAGMGQGSPEAGTNSYQLDALKGAIGLNFIIVNNSVETIKGMMFTFDSSLGKIMRYQGDGVTPNNWNTGDVLIANFSKLI